MILLIIFIEILSSEDETCNSGCHIFPGSNIDLGFVNEFLNSLITWLSTISAGHSIPPL